MPKYRSKCKIIQKKRKKKLEGLKHWVIKKKGKKKRERERDNKERKKQTNHPAIEEKKESQVSEAKIVQKKQEIIKLIELC